MSNTNTEALHRLTEFLLTRLVSTEIHGFHNLQLLTSLWDAGEKTGITRLDTQ